MAARISERGTAGSLGGEAVGGLLEQAGRGQILGPVGREAGGEGGRGVQLDLHLLAGAALELDAGGAGAVGDEAAGEGAGVALGGGVVEAGGDEAGAGGLGVAGGGVAVGAAG